jgi:uncharacterized protein
MWRGKGRMPMRRRSGAALCAAAGLLLAGEAAAQCAPDVADIRDDGTEVRFSVELADTPETRARGLMFREELPRFGGMLFVYDQPQRATFWMENTPLPLDMLFFDEAGVLRTVHENAEPFSRETIFGGDEILYVLEINGGMAEALGLEPGAELRHPAVDPEAAAWPCPEGGAS